MYEHDIVYMYITYTLTSCVQLQLEQSNDRSKLAKLQHCRPKSIGKLPGIQWIRLDYHQEFYYFNCYQVFSSNPKNLGFCLHTNPGLWVWKSTGIPGFSGARYPSCISYHCRTRLSDQDVDVVWYMSAVCWPLDTHYINCNLFLYFWTIVLFRRLF